jgi:hypothetical protein
MERYLYGLLIALILITGCTGISQYTADLQGDKTIVYVMGRNRSILGGADLRVCDRWSYDTKTKELKLERSDSSSTDNKSVFDAVKGIPTALPIPY